MLYLVLREGAHISGIGGIYNDAGIALAEARKLLTAEPDDYHSYTVTPHEPGETAKLEGSGVMYRRLTIIEPMYTLKRVKGEIYTDAGYKG